MRRHLGIFAAWAVAVLAGALGWAATRSFAGALAFACAACVLFFAVIGVIGGIALAVAVVTRRPAVSRFLQRPGTVAVKRSLGLFGFCACAAGLGWVATGSPWGSFFCFAGAYAYLWIKGLVRS